MLKYKLAILQSMRFVPSIYRLIHVKYLCIRLKYILRKGKCISLFAELSQFSNLCTFYSLGGDHFNILRSPKEPSLFDTERWWRVLEAELR